MSKHLFGLIVTPYGTAANNHGENEGNITTLQKILWKNEVHTTVSAEAIRWAFRYYWQKRSGYESVNRRWNDESGDHDWQDQTWKPWTNFEEKKNKLPTFIDDDVLGFMLAEAAGTDGNDELGELKKDKKNFDDEFKSLSKEDQRTADGKSLKEKIKITDAKIKLMAQGKTSRRKGRLEVTRAISLRPFAGDLTFNAKSGTKSKTSLYATEVHATRYQYGFALTPESLREKARVLEVVEAAVNLAAVAGNQSRFLFDFAPDSVVFRWTDDFAPRFLYGFEMDAEANLSFPAVLEKVKSGDISAHELFIGGNIVSRLSASENSLLSKASLHGGVKAAADALKTKIKADLKITEG